MMMFDTPHSRDLRSDTAQPARLLRITDAELLAAMRVAANEADAPLDDPYDEDDAAYASVSWVA
ncbi:hypothetical protein [Niveibacterium sp. SC-1]|uniref:hypothetical protein n=1 Tax=Niveibacterium sp. SC-1 TaxID=3135646 RepID=UPI00311FE949